MYFILLIIIEKRERQVDWYTVLCWKCICILQN